MHIEHVEQYGLDVDGIYRVSGNLAVIQKLRFAVNHGEVIFPVVIYRRITHTVRIGLK